MKTGVGALVGILAVVLLIVGGSTVHGNATLAQDDDSVRVMTYNIRHGQGNDDCEDEQVSAGTPAAAQCSFDLGRTADLIASFEPDIIALQEVDRFWARSGGLDQPAEFVDALGVYACYGVNLDHEPDGHATKQHQYGNAILSAYPILSCENTLLPTAEGWEQRGLLEVRVDIPGVGEVAVLDTHLQTGRAGEEDEAARQRAEQAEAVADRVAELDLPVILMGDFNADPDAEEVSSLLGADSDLQDGWDVAGGDGSDGFTTPASPDEDASRRIDYILATSDVEFQSVEVPVTDDTRVTSDHLPVVADVAIAADPSATPSRDDGTPEADPTSEATFEPTEVVVPTAVPVEPAPPATEELDDSDDGNGEGDDTDDGSGDDSGDDGSGDDGSGDDGSDDSDDLGPPSQQEGEPAEEQEGEPGD